MSWAQCGLWICLLGASVLLAIGLYPRKRRNHFVERRDSDYRDWSRAFMRSLK